MGWAMMLDKRPHGMLAPSKQSTHAVSTMCALRCARVLCNGCRLLSWRGRSVWGPVRLWRGEQGTSPSRVSYSLAHASRCLEALVAGAVAALIITLHDNTITMAATSWAVSVLPPSMSAETRLTPSASFLCERLDCHAGALFRSRNHLPFVSAAGSRSSRQPRLPIKQRRPQARRHLCDGCVQSPDEIYSR